MARIALDAMGGDFAPHAPVAGALLALEELGPEHSILLVGRTEVVRGKTRGLVMSGKLSRGDAQGAAQTAGKCLMLAQ